MAESPKVDGSPPVPWERTLWPTVLEALGRELGDHPALTRSGVSWLVDEAAATWVNRLDAIQLVHAYGQLAPRFQAPVSGGMGMNQMVRAMAVRAVWSRLAAEADGQALLAGGLAPGNA